MQKTLKQRKRECHSCPNHSTGSIDNFFPADGVWLVQENQCSARCLGPLPGELELTVMVVLEQLRPAMIATTKELFDKMCSPGGISYDTGATIILEGMRKRIMEQIGDKKSHGL